MEFRNRFRVVFALFIVWGLGLLQMSWAQQFDKRAQESANALKAFMNQPSDKQIPVSVVKQAQCIIVVPGLVKVSVAVGYKAGKGLAICRQEDTNEWGAPAFYNVKGPSVGMSLGGAASDVVILAMNEMAEDALISGAVTLGGGSATAVAGSTGAQVAAGGASAKAPFYTYARAKGGVFAGLDVGSLSVQFNKEANTNAYKREMTPLQTLLEVNETPPALTVFTDAVKEFAPSK